jgi:hypothetical protein
MMSVLYQILAILIISPKTLLSLLLLVKIRLKIRQIKIGENEVRIRINAIWLHKKRKVSLEKSAFIHKISNLSQICTELAFPRYDIDMNHDMRWDRYTHKVLFWFWHTSCSSYIATVFKHTNQTHCFFYGLAKPKRFLSS